MGFDILAIHSSQVEITKFPEGSIRNPNNFIEVPVIKGSVPEMIKRTMEKLQDTAIYDQVTKVNYQMEAIRYTSYPYAALEDPMFQSKIRRLKIIKPLFRVQKQCLKE